MTKAERRELSETLEREENLNSQSTSKFKKKTGYNPGEFVLKLVFYGWWALFATSMIIMLVLIFKGIGGCVEIAREIETTIEAEKEYAITQEYTFYLNGNEVDPGTIDMDHYRISFDHEGKKVFLATKNNEPFLPLPIPVYIH